MKRLVPEVVQTSAMDCGPATLKSVLNGFGVEASFGRLREACQTDVDGTNIDTLEDVANQLGLDASQEMVPIDHVMEKQAAVLPCIAVVRLPSGVTHFVVVWKRHGNFVQIMDPGHGRQFVRATRWLRDVYLHQMPVPMGDWREYGGSAEFSGPLGQRLLALGAGPNERRRLIDEALRDPGWRPIAALDAATRLAQSLVTAGGLKRGRAAARLVEVLARAAAQPEHDEDIPDHYWSVRPIADDPESLLLRGAVVLHCEPKARRSAADESAPPPSRASELSPELVAALAEPPPRPGRRLLGMLFADGRLAPALLILSMALATTGVLLEALVARGFFEVSRLLGPVEQRIGAVVVVLLLTLAMMLLDVPVRIWLLRLGRRVEIRMRLAFFQKLPALSDRYFSSRLNSDMAERSHVLHVLRQTSLLGGALLQGTFALIATVAAIAWLDPRSGPLAALTAAVCLALPLVVQPWMGRLDLRFRTHTAALSRFYLDGLLGSVPARTHNAESAIVRGHEGLLVDWTRAGLELQKIAVLLEGLQGLLGYGMAALVLFFHVQRTDDSGAVLLLAYWTMSLPTLAGQVALAARQYPALRNVMLRVMEPLDAPEQPTPELANDAQALPGSGGVDIDLNRVTVNAGGHPILEEVTLSVPAGAHVAMVGPSGAGKSSLVGLLLGWHRPREGTVRVDGVPLDGQRLAELRRRTAWVDPSVCLWNQSLYRNLCYGSDGQLAMPIGQLTEAADLRQLLEELPDGLQTDLGEGGALVSGGEGQRVRLGRALAHGLARLVILDEPFRGLDRERREALLRSARQRYADATLLYISHDVSHALDFDRVLVIDHGRIVEDGAPTALAGDPASRFATMLAAERSIRTGLWLGDGWRRWWLEGGLVTERGR